MSRGGSLVTVSHPAVGEVTAPPFPGRLAETPCDFTGPPPPIPGEHTEAILAEHGFEDDEISELLQTGVVGGAGDAELDEERRQR